jgi:hypothetical protein
MTLAPKTEYQKGIWSRQHAELCASPTFQATLQTALVQMLYDEGSPADPVIASATWHRMAGARAFVHVLLNLAEPPPEKKIEPHQNIAFPKR